MLLASRQADSTRAPLQLLLLCTGNSARSIMAEALFNSLGKGYFRAFSAGSHPTGKVNPFALEQLSQLHLNFKPRSKSWDEFSGNDVPMLDIVITVCASAAAEACPHFVGAEQRVYWGLPDPAAVVGNDENIRKAFTDCFRILRQRITQLIKLLEKSNASQQLDRSEVATLMRQLADTTDEASLKIGNRHYAQLEKSGNWS